MSEFKVGEKITAKNDAQYLYTNSNAIVQVEKIDNDGMLEVKLLGYKNPPTKDNEWEFNSVIGHTFHVNSEDFKHFKNNKKENKKTMKTKKSYPYYEVRERGRKIVVIYHLDANHKYKGESCCHKSDIFNFKVGFDIAYDRVMEIIADEQHKEQDKKKYVWLDEFSGWGAHRCYVTAKGQVNTGKELRTELLINIPVFIQMGYLLELLNQNK